LGIYNYWLQTTTAILAEGEFRHYEFQNPALSIILSCSFYLLLHIILLYDRIKLIVVPLLWYLKYTFLYWIFVNISCFRILHICQYNEMSLFPSLTWPPLVLRNVCYKICRLEFHLGLLLGCWLQTEVFFLLPTGLTVFIVFFLIFSTGSVIPIQRPNAKVQQVGLATYHLPAISDQVMIEWIYNSTLQYCFIACTRTILPYQNLFL
jgi:hypothetical protein